MKQTILLCAMLFCIGRTYSQSVLSFCARVDQNGYCLFNNSKFLLSPDSTSAYIYLEIMNPHTFAGTSKITFKIYSVEKNGDEKYETMTEQNVQDTWMYAWVPHEFNGPGKYDVKIYNDKNELLISRYMEIMN